MNFFGKFKNKHLFKDGGVIFVLHRYALRFEFNGNFIDIGFESAFEFGFDVLVHANSISTWSDSKDEKKVTASEKEDILKRIKEYCHVRGLSYRVVD